MASAPLPNKTRLAILAVGAVATLGITSAVVVRTGTSSTQHGYVREAGENSLVIEQNPAAWPNYRAPCGGDLNCRHEPLETLVTHTGCNGDTNCFRFHGNPVDQANCNLTNGCPNDRLEIRLSDLNDADALHLQHWMYERFSVRFDPSTDISAGVKSPRTSIAQVWQNTTTGLGPPLGVAAADVGTNVRLDFTFKASPDPAAPNNTAYSILVPKSDTDFTTLCWKMKPAPTGPRGVVLIWTGDACNGNIDLLPQESAVNWQPEDLAPYGQCIQVAAWSSYCKSIPHHVFNWGYPLPDPGIDAFRISVGLYRPPIMGNILFWMDDIRLATNGAALAGA